ncbi:hypothetical protein QLX08_008085 [Tetragonisca angustula]|uniref:Uncharacterized protein n=1 Tax=Tetragonisca angustula TaxID=166442 RepID=A0AAW0ZLS1_9HYME
MSQQGPDSNLEAEAEIKISRRQTTLGGALSPTRDNFVSRLRGATAVDGAGNEIRGTEFRGGASRQPPQEAVTARLPFNFTRLELGHVILDGPAQFSKKILEIPRSCFGS